MRWAARLGGPGIDAEDVVQDVFLVAKRRLKSFDGPGNIKTWLFRTTEKIVQAARRKRRLRRWLSRSAEPAASGMSASRPTPAEALERDREIGEVYRILDRLPERQRRVLVLFELEGLSTQEIAELVGAQVGTVRVWLFRARARFLEEHQRLFQPDPGSTNQGRRP
jgi:RNA polymerase sigma-70 factor (ECF subfamily)